MDGTPDFTLKEWPLVFALGRAIAEASTFDELHTSAEQPLAALLRAQHVALCMPRLDNPSELEFRTSTLGPLLHDLSSWQDRDFVSRSVRESPNMALTDKQMLRGQALEDTDTWQRSRDKGLDLRRVLASLILPEGPGVMGGVILYGEDRPPFAKKSQQVLDWFIPNLRRAFQSIHRFAEATTRQQVLESLAGQDSASVVLTSRGGEILRTPAATGVLYRWFSRFELSPSGIPHQWLEQLSFLVRTDGQARADLYTWRREGTCRDLEVTFLPLPRKEGSQLWEVRMKERVLLPEPWRRLLKPKLIEVSEYVLRGWMDKDIALAMGIALDTAKGYAQESYKRVGADGRSDFISRALRF